MGVTPSWKKRLKASHGCSGRTCSRFCGRAKVIIGLRPALRAPTTFDVKGLMYGQVGLFWLSLSFIVFSRNNPLLKWEKTKDKDEKEPDREGARATDGTSNLWSLFRFALTC